MWANICVWAKATWLIFWYGLEGAQKKVDEELMLRSEQLIEKVLGNKTGE